MTPIKDLIVNSATIQKPIKTVYQGHTRYLCVHGIGYKDRIDGSRVLQMIAYQYDGNTSKGPVKYGNGHKENWRCMDISQIQEVDILEDGEWYSSDNHSAPSSCVDDYIFQVSH